LLRGFHAFAKPVPEGAKFRNTPSACGGDRNFEGFASLLLYKEDTQTHGLNQLRLSCNNSNFNNSRAAIFGLAKPYKAARRALKKAQKESLPCFRV
jgi:hypothetical protein